MNRKEKSWTAAAITLAACAIGPAAAGSRLSDGIASNEVPKLIANLAKITERQLTLCDYQVTCMTEQFLASAWVNRSATETQLLDCLPKEVVDVVEAAHNAVAIKACLEIHQVAETLPPRFVGYNEDDVIALQIAAMYERCGQDRACIDAQFSAHIWYIGIGLSGSHSLDQIALCGTFITGYDAKPEDIFSVDPVAMKLCLEEFATR